MAAALADNGFPFVQPVCQNCQTSTTPLWRRDEMGSVLCNACGLFLKLHGRPRPISLKTDVIKSRNRVKSTAHGQRKKVSLQAHAYLSILVIVLTKVPSSPLLTQMASPYPDPKLEHLPSEISHNGDLPTNSHRAPLIDPIHQSPEYTPPTYNMTQISPRSTYSMDQS